MKKCLDEGMIQAYHDGELGPAAAQAAAAHLARCEACSAALAEVETETAFLSASFAPDAALNVPTEILRARVGAAVARLEAEAAVPARSPRGWNFGALLAPFGGLLSFTPQRAAAFATLLAAVALGVLFFAARQRTTPGVEGGEVAKVENPAPRPAEAAAPKAEPGRAEANPVVQTPAPPLAIPARAEKVSAKRRAPAAGRQPVSPSPSETAAAPKAGAGALVPGEQNYREAIASLEQVVKAGGDAVLAPKARIEYERNIAVLDRAIEETRSVALSNPKNKDAVGFLMSAYQSKVELLSAVADQTQVAAAGR